MGRPKRTHETRKFTVPASLVSAPVRAVFPDPAGPFVRQAGAADAARQLAGELSIA
jgi:hypothetical protein